MKLLRVITEWVHVSLEFKTTNVFSFHYTVHKKELEHLWLAYLFGAEESVVFREVQ